MSRVLKSDRAEMVFSGLPVNSGKVAAQACLYSNQTHRAVATHLLESEEEVAEELRRFDQALEECSLELDKITERVEESIGKTEAEIFAAQKHIMNDPAILDAIRDGVKNRRLNIEAVISEVFGVYEKKFANLDMEYLRERSSDIADIRRRLLSNLHNTKPGFVCQGQEKCSRGKDRIIVARELSADMMVHMDLEHVMGIVTEHGGMSSHAAILARSMGVPSVSGVHDIMSHVNCGSYLLVDGDSGSVYVEPQEDLVKEMLPVDPVQAQRVCVLESPAGTRVMANASLLDDVRSAASLHADGIGLFRTEILFMFANRLLSEQEQYDYYAQVMQMMAGKPVTFRLLDVGGDKPLPFLKMQEESNPYLGWRGARFLLGSPEIFTTQVRALARLSALGEVNILMPMIIDMRQLQNLHFGIMEVIHSVKEARLDNIRIGIMFEVPSACLQAKSIFSIVDFASVGSNDLIQYLFAVDRNNELVSQDYDPDHPVLWDILRNLSAAAQSAGKPLSICGEMAGRSGLPVRLVRTGISSLSVSPRLIPRVRTELSESMDKAHTP
ncbi:MAG: phosphoenolpyruvate--protein phosphotransferase, partial [Chitinispirillaceae bacterium]